MLQFRPADAAVAPAADLIEAMISELVTFYGRIDGDDTPSARPEDFGPPAGVYLVGWDGDVPVAGGGIKRLDRDTAEIKRMFVVPERRGEGVGRALLVALEDAARTRGYRTVRLDTGPHAAAPAALYRSAGYVEIPDYNGNPHATFWAEKAL